ncbi:MAG: hypothetical protein H0V88_13145, partial [Pyrinomonadaceae bacterium]|nr:hypothetical protein [Pyrinomonadaceae bacterium]
VVWAYNVSTDQIIAQDRRRGSDRATRPADSKARSRERANKAARLREQALTTLAATADEARTLDDPEERARVLTHIADALWLADQTRARAIFRQAWEAATVADKAAEEAEGETNFAASTNTIITEARDEVLAKAALRDKELAETFLRALLAARNEEDARSPTETQTSPRQFDLWRTLSAGGQRRLALAYELLSKGKAKRAAEIAAPLTVEGASADLITFLLRLRGEDAAAADGLYLTLVERTRANFVDENDALLLSSYIFSPQLLVTIDANGAVQFRVIPSGRNSAQDLKASTPVVGRARTAFYETAAAVLLRPAQVTEITAQATDATTTAASTRSYFAIERLLPFFEREAPQYAQALRAQRESLANKIDAARRQQLAGQAARLGMTSANATDPLRSQTGELAAARTENERDRLRLKLVRTAVGRKLWDDARHFAAEITDAELRRATNVLIAANQIANISDAYAENTADDYERAAEFVNRADVPPFVRAWGLAQAAVMAKKRNHTARARELLGEASTYAAQAETRTGQRAAAFAMLTKTASTINDERAWEWLSETMQATNSAADFDFEETSFSLLHENAATMGEDETTENDFRIASDEFRLDAAFVVMSKLDAARAFATARALERKESRLLAMAAIARSVLEQRETLPPASGA